MNEKTKKPTGLIRNMPLIPNIQDTYIEKKKGRSSKATELTTIKISTETKKDLDNLIMVTQSSYLYNMVDQIVSYYIEHALNEEDTSLFNQLRNKSVEKEL